MRIEIRRYHLAFLFLALCALSAIGIVSVSRERPKEAQELPPIHEIVPRKKPELAPARIETKKPVSEKIRPARPAPKPAAAPAKWIALTFDDGPHPGYTERLLEILRDQEAPATFFVVGKQAELHPDLVERIAAEGHELANHTYAHPDLRTLTSSDVIKELDQTQRVIRTITNAPMKFFRPPGGQYDAHVIQAADEAGYTMALWDVLPKDHTNPDAEVILERVFEKAQNGSVILLHSGIDHTLDALPRLIQELKRRGFRFVTVSDMNRKIPLTRFVNKAQP